MNETKFTPGPWHVTEARGHNKEHLYYEIRGDTEEYRGDLAHMQHSEGISGTTREENDANALLVSTAPDGYALAEAVAEHFKDTDAPLGEQARRLLAKARGE